MVRLSRVTLSGQNLTLGKVAEHHEDLVASLRFSFNVHSPFATIRFPAATPHEIHARLSERLLETEVGSVMSAFKYRHWIAHGRYWSPKLGQNYDFFGVHTLAQLVESSIPFVSASESG